MKTNATLNQLEKALKTVNKKYNNNVQFNRFPELKGKQFIFTLRVKDSHKPGARLGFTHNKNGNRRHLINACWHVHGDFFEALFTQDKNIFVWSGTNKITYTVGNWQDRNIGSMIEPFYFSEACDC